MRRVGGVDASYPTWILTRARCVRRLRRGSRASDARGSDSEDFARAEAPLPPLNEQRRIVAAIEEHFSRLDAADASLARRHGGSVL